MSHRFACLLMAALFGTCISTTALATSPSLTWRGDITTAQVVMRAAAKAWAKAGHGNIVLQPFNTASGLDAVRNGSVDLAGAARSSYGNLEKNLVFTPVAWDALVLITHPSNPVNNLSLQQVHDIYFGKITNWNQLGGKNEPINLYAVFSPGDGVEYSLRQLIFGHGNQSVAAPRLYINTSQLEAGIALDPQSLGVSTFADVIGNRRLKILKIQGVAPTRANVANGVYPLYTPLYVVTNPANPKAAQIKAFLNFLDTAKAKRILRAHHVLPYKDDIKLAALDRFRRADILADVSAPADITVWPPSQPHSPVATLGLSSVTDRHQAFSTATTLETPPPLPALHSGIRQAPAISSQTKLAFAAVSAQSISTAKPSFKNVHGSAITVVEQARHSRLFAQISSEVLIGGLTLHTHTTGRATTPIHHYSAHAPAGSTAGKRVKQPLVTSVYRVSHGDTLYSIARRNHVSVAQVRTWNDLKDNLLRPGQVLRLYVR